MRNPGALPSDTPVELRAAITQMGAAVDHVECEASRTYLWLDSPTRRLFARYSREPTDVAVLRHEALARAAVGERDVLRAPAVLDRGETWMVEHRIDPLPLVGPDAIDLVVAAASTLASLPVPAAPPSPPESRPARAVRRLRTLTVPSLVGDLRRVSTLRRDLALPTVTTHGDFHPGNLLLTTDAVYVIDWELTGPGLAGSDLLQLWTSLPGDGDRARLFDATIELVGTQFRHELAQLRYTLLVQTIAAKVATALPASRDRRGARRLLGLLPEVREAARREPG